jgi:hypothetical protein
VAAPAVGVEHSRAVRAVRPAVQIQVPEPPVAAAVLPNAHAATECVVSVAVRDQVEDDMDGSVPGGHPTHPPADRVYPARARRTAR